MSDENVIIDNQISFALIGIGGFIVTKLFSWWLKVEKSNCEKCPCISITEFETSIVESSDPNQIVTGLVETDNPRVMWRKYYNENIVGKYQLHQTNGLKIQDPHFKTSLGSEVIEPFSFTIHPKKFINMRCFNESLNYPSWLISSYFAQDKLHNSDRVTFLVKNLGHDNILVEYAIQGTKRNLIDYLKRKSNIFNNLSKIFACVGLFFLVKSIGKFIDNTVKKVHYKCTHLSGGTRKKGLLCNHFTFCLDCYESMKDNKCPICINQKN